MRTIEAMLIVIRQRQAKAKAPHQQPVISAQADILAEAVDMQMEAQRAWLKAEFEHLEKELGSRLTQARKVDTSGPECDPE